MFRYATEVDVDFVRKAVRAIGRCAIKVEQAAERCVSTLIDLIQTKVNYVVQEAIVVIKVNDHLFFFFKIIILFFVGYFS
jgi:vesicle coat complex subunit